MRPDYEAQSIRLLAQLRQSIGALHRLSSDTRTVLDASYRLLREPAEDSRMDTDPREGPELTDSSKIA